MNDDTARHRKVLHRVAGSSVLAGLGSLVAGVAVLFGTGAALIAGGVVMLLTGWLIAQVVE